MESCSEEQLLAEETGSRTASQKRPSASHADSSPQVSTPYQSIDSQQDLTSMPTNSLHDHIPHQLPTSMHEQLAQQLPSSFASMSTSFMSPNSGALGQFDGPLPGQYQSLQMPDSHDSAWLQGQVAAALQEQQQQQQSTLAWQQATSALQSPGLNQDVQLLLSAHQQNLQQQQQMYGQQQHKQLYGQQQQQQARDQQHWDQQQQQQQQQLLTAAGLQGSLHSYPGILQGTQSKHHTVSSSGEPI